MLGVQVTPLIHFWDRTEHPLEISLEPWELHGVVFDGAIGGSRFLVSLGGYIATEESEPRLAARNLNAFLFSLTLLRDHSTDPVGEHELDDSNFDNSARTLRPSRGKLSRLGSAFAWYPDFQLRVAKEATVHVCSADVVPIIAELGDCIVKSDFEVAFYEAHIGLSAKHDGEPIATFVSFWIVFEMMLATEIRRFLRGQGTADIRIDKQLQKWNIPSKVRKLKRWNAIQALGPGDPTPFSAADLHQVSALAPVRNRVVHAGYRPSSTEVKQAADLSWRAMWRFFRLSGILYQRYVDDADKIQTAFASKHNLR